MRLAAIGAVCVEGRAALGAGRRLSSLRMSGKEVQHRLSPGKRPLEVIQRADRNAGQAGASAVRVSAAQWIAKTDLLFERVNYHVDIRVAAKASPPG
jgi:hypothetical protein